METINKGGILKRIVQNDEIAENIITLLSLNQDCWLLICDLLSCKDILNLAKASPAYAKYMKNYVLPLKFKKLEIPVAYNDNYIDEEDFRFLLESIWHTVKIVYLSYLSDQHFELLKLYRFPCVSEIRINLDRRMNDTDMRIFHQIFPNLRSIIPHYGCSTQTIELFNNLENLTLSYCRNITINDFQHILLTLNLKSLTLNVYKKVTKLNYEAQVKLSKIQELTVNCYELSWLSSYDASNPIVFTNLKTLIITGSLAEVENIENLFRDIKEIVSRDVYEIEMANACDEFLCNFLVPEKYDFLNQVHTLSFINVNILLEIFGIPGKFKALRELYFFYCHSKALSDVALKIISNSELDLLSFEECQMPDIDESYLKALRMRKKPLTFNFYSHEKKLQVNCCGKYENLIKFTQKSYISSNFDSITIKFR